MFPKKRGKLNLPQCDMTHSEKLVFQFQLMPESGHGIQSLAPRPTFPPYPVVDLPSARERPRIFPHRLFVFQRLRFGRYARFGEGASPLSPCPLCLVFGPSCPRHSTNGESHHLLSLKERSHRAGVRHCFPSGQGSSCTSCTQRTWEQTFVGGRTLAKF